MNLKTLETKVSMWSEKNFPGNKPYHPLLGIGEEVGELMHAHLKMEQGIRGSAEQHHTAKEDAVGDIVIYLADYCWRNGIDFEHAVTKAWDEVSRRDWTKHPESGTSMQHYHD
jgi:NTP pyrophosphatase (non-canonical NTP hydrolase)